MTFFLFSVKEKSQNKMDIETQPSESEPTAAYSQSNYEEVKEYEKHGHRESMCYIYENSSCHL